jgi:hypothetical protein
VREVADGPGQPVQTLRVERLRLTSIQPFKRLCEGRAPLQALAALALLTDDLDAESFPLGSLHKQGRLRIQAGTVFGLVQGADADVAEREGLIRGIHSQDRTLNGRLVYTRVLLLGDVGTEARHRAPQRRQVGILSPWDRANAVGRAGWSADDMVKPVQTPQTAGTASTALQVEDLEERARMLRSMLAAIDAGTLEATTQQRAFTAGALCALEEVLVQTVTRPT